MTGALESVTGATAEDNEAINNLLAEMQGAGALKAQNEMGVVN